MNIKLIHLLDRINSTSCLSHQMKSMKKLYVKVLLTNLCLAARKLHLPKQTRHLNSQVV